MHLEAIDNDLWYVVENGVPSVTPSLNAADVKRFKQLDSQAKNIICGHLSIGKYGIVSALETAKLIWDRLSKVNEGVSTQRDSRVDVLRNLFNRFKRLDNENVQQTFDRLTNISNELQALGATDITDHEVVKKLLRSLDSSFATLAQMIQERAGYKSLDPADILERLNTHEFQLAEKRDLYGPSYGRSRALKAKAVSKSEGEDSGSSLGDPEELSQELVVGERSISKNLPTITQDLSRRSIATSEESVSTYPRRPKAEAFINVVDVVVHLDDPSRPSTECTTPPRSTHVQLADVITFLTQQDGRSSR